jgi:spore germination cell wall hydrolase CwlJ-like protein
VMVIAFFLTMGYLIDHLPRALPDGSVRFELPGMQLLSGAEPDEQAPALPDPAALLPLTTQGAQASNDAVSFHPPTVIAPPWPAVPWQAGARERAADCLAAAAWYEAGDDPTGERAVIQVVLNRARHPAFQPTICGTVFQGSTRKTGCQFTFTCDGSLLARQPSATAWTRARAIALAALNGAVVPEVGLATHYHADYVVPYWRDSLVKLSQIGAHIFYNWPGYWGTRTVLGGGQYAGDEPVQPQLATISAAHGGQLAYDGAVLAGSLSDTTATNAVLLGNNPDIGLLATHHGLATGVNAAGQGVVANNALAPVPAAGTATETIELPLDAAAFAGSYAVRAYGLCKGKPRCVVLGRIAGDELAQTPGANRLGFLYVHDSKSGAEGVWWNCSRTPRADRHQCLPEGAAAVRLVASWM